MTAAATGEEIVGRGLREGKYLFAQWFMRLGQAAENEELAAYVFVMGSLVEVLRGFDLHIAASGDLDNDGDTDFVISTLNGPRSFCSTTERRITGSD